MIWTEREAKDRLCPVITFPDGNTRCAASDCMMWRKHGQIGLGPNGEKRDRDMDGMTRWVDRGYCGLAGTPLPELSKSMVARHHE